MKKKKNGPSKTKPPAKYPKQQITIRLDGNTIHYFKKLASQSGLPYQNLINLYLKDCVQSRRKPNFKWAYPNGAKGLN